MPVHVSSCPAQRSMESYLVLFDVWPSGGPTVNAGPASWGIWSCSLHRMRLLDKADGVGIVAMYYDLRLNRFLWLFLAYGITGTLFNSRPCWGTCRWMSCTSAILYPSSPARIPHADGGTLCWIRSHGFIAVSSRQGTVSFGRGEGIEGVQGVSLLDKDASRWNKMKPDETKTQRPVPTEHVDAQHSVQALAVCQRKGLRPKLRSVLLSLWPPWLWAKNCGMVNLTALFFCDFAIGDVSGEEVAYLLGRAGRVSDALRTGKEAAMPGTPMIHGRILNDMVSC